jgi:hypothetical protein
MAKGERAVPGQSYQLPVPVKRRLGRTEMTFALSTPRFPDSPRTAENHRISNSSHASGPVDSESTNSWYRCSEAEQARFPTRSRGSPLRPGPQTAGFARRRAAPTRLPSTYKQTIPNMVGTVCLTSYHCYHIMATGNTSLARPKKICSFYPAT